MKRTAVAFLVVCGVFAGTPGQAAAQGATWADRGYINVGWGVCKTLTVGVGYRQEQNDTDGQLSGSIPSPVFFNRPRTLSDTVTGLDRKEAATHLNFGWVFPVNEKLDVLVYAGPSFF